MGDERRRLGEREEAVAPPGVPHRWWNDSDDAEAHVRVELRPALNSETFFETLNGLARDGRTGKNGAPNLPHQAVTLTGINEGEIYLTTPPVPVQKAVGAGGAGPPSKASVVARGAALVGRLLVASSLLIGKMRRRSKG